MNLLFRIEGNGYVITNNGVDWVVQESFIPFPRDTIEESAQAHIDDIIAKEQEQQQEAVTIAQLQQQITDLQDALIELASAVEGGAA